MASQNSNTNKQYPGNTQDFSNADDSSGNQIDCSGNSVSSTTDLYDREASPSEINSEVGTPSRRASPPNYQSISDESSDDGTESTIPSAFVKQPMNYSATKVRIVLLIVVTLSSVSFSTQPSISQYLLTRFSEENGHSRCRLYNNTTVPDRGFCDKNDSNPWVKEEDRVQAKVSVATMNYSLTTSLPALVSIMIFGALVDIIGRKIALVTSLLGGTCQLVVVICTVKLNLSPNFLYLAYACDGIGGSYFVNLIACFAITADISCQKDSRIIGIVIVGVLGTAMFAVFNIVVGVLIKRAGYVIAFSAILAPLVLALFIAVFFLPETLPTPKQKASPKRVLTYSASMFTLLFRNEDKNTRWSLIISLLIFFTGLLNNVNVGSLDTLYQKHAPLCWDAEQLGYYSSFRNSGASVLAFIFLCIWRCAGCASDEVMAMIGMLFVVGSYVLEAFVTNTWQMYMVPIVVSPGANVVPITRGVMSLLAGPDKQGLMFSSIALIESLCSLSAAVVYNKIYAATVAFMPGFVYLTMAATALVTFLLYIPFFHFYNRRQLPSLEKSIQVNDTPDHPSSSESDPLLSTLTGEGEVA